MLGRHPPGLLPLFFTEMWERFSFYTMGSLLTLYMDAPADSGGLGLPAGYKEQIYGLYGGLVYLTPLFGGLLADRLWGFIRTVTLGGVVMMGGHLALAGQGLAFFFTGLVLLIVGNGLFKPNISTLLGNLYPDRPELKDQGFNIFYMGINLGALAAPVSANWLKNYYGWHIAFGSAAVGMVIALVIFRSCRRLIAGGEHLPAETKNQRQTEPEVPPKVEWLRVRALLIIFAVVTLFWMAFNQNGLTLTRWARDHTAPFLGIDFEHNAALVLALNPALVIVLTPLVVLFWGFLRQRGLDVSTPRKIALGMLLSAGCFLVMGLAALQLDEHDRGRVSVDWLIAGYVLITLGELCLSPMGLSVVSKLAPPRFAGLLMGGWFVSSALGNYLSGALGAYWNAWPHATFFFVLVGSSLVAAAVLFALMEKLEMAMPAEKGEGKKESS